VSEKTVEGHLRNAFAKLGVSARAAVAEAVGARARGMKARRGTQVPFRIPRQIGCRCYQGYGEKTSCCAFA